MEDLKLEEDDATPEAAQGPSPFGPGPLPRTLFFRETGVSPWQARGKRTVVTAPPKPHNNRRLQDEVVEEVDSDEEQEPKKCVVSFSTKGTSGEVAEEHLIARTRCVGGAHVFKVTPCKLRVPASGEGGGNPGGPADPQGLGVVPGFHNGFGGMAGANGTRTTYLMVFSPDKRLMASAHGDHNVYVSRVSDGGCVRVLTGHPRSPWCVAFHPSRDGILASACLAGHVRVWDVASGCSELYRADVVISHQHHISLAFHPIEQFLVIATHNELHFWDWSKRRPFEIVRTASEMEKVRYVKFDAVGHILVTGIANLGPLHQDRLHADRLPPVYNRPASFSNLGPPGPTESRIIASYEERRSRLMNRYERMLQQQYRDLTPSRSSNNSAAEDNDVSPSLLPSALAAARTRARYSGSPSSSAATSSASAGPGLLMDRGTDPMLPSTSTRATLNTTTNTSTSSMSTTHSLSDLAQAASIARLAENNSTTALRQQASETATPSPASPSSRESSVERENPEQHLLNDHSYSFGVRQRARMMPPQSASALDHSYTRRAHGALADLRERVRELSRTAEAAAVSGFSHSPESEFVEVGSGHPASRSAFGDGHPIRGSSRAPDMFLNPDRSPSSEANMRYQSSMHRRFRELVERREAIRRQLERRTDESGSQTPPTAIRRNLTNMLLPPLPTPPSVPTTPQASPYRGPAFREDHNYGATPAQRPIDEWAVNRRMNLEVMEAAREAASDSQPHVLTADEVASATAPVVDNARFIDEALQDAIPPEMRLPSYDDPPARSGARESWRSQQLRHSLHHRLPPGLNRVTRVRINPPPEERTPRVAASGNNGTSDSASNTDQGSGESRERVRHNAEIQGNDGATNEDSRDETASTAATAGSPQPPTATATPTADSTPSTSSGGAAAASGGDQEQNQDIVRLSSHIERMQRICRQSLSSLGTVPMATQRRQVVRLQAIRRMLEDLQRQIRSLRDASYRELDRRARMEVGRRERDQRESRHFSPQVDRQTGNSATRTTTTLTDSSAAARLRQRSTAVLSRIAAGGSHSHSRHRVMSRRGTVGAASGSGGRNSPAGSRSGVARSAAVPRPRLSRAHSQLVSQLRATFRAMEMSPDLARNRNNPVALSRAEESRLVMERTSQEAVSVVYLNNSNGDENNGARNELRAMSQRLERAVREQRETGDQMPGEDEPMQIFIEGEERGFDDMQGPPPLPYQGGPGPPIPYRRGPRGIRTHAVGTAHGGVPYFSSTSESDDDDEDDSDQNRNEDAFVNVTSRVGPTRRPLTRSGAVHRRLLHRSVSDGGGSGGGGGGGGVGNTGGNDLRGDVPVVDRGGRSGGGGWRASSSFASSAARDRIDMRAGLRRDEERERRRISRERDISRRRRRYLRWNGDLDLIAYPARPRDGHDYLGAAGMNMYPVGSGRYDNGARSRTPSPLGREAATAAGGASSNPNLPPLREIIWRRLRRRNAQLNMLEEQAAEELRAAAAADAGSNDGVHPTGGVGGDHSRFRQHREALSSMVDQLTLDQQAAAAAAAAAAQSAYIHDTAHAEENWQQWRRQQQQNLRAAQALHTRRQRIAERIQAGRDANRYSPHPPHRIQAWEIHSPRSRFPPDIADSSVNIVVKEAMIHSDASVDFAGDGSFLVTLVPSNLPMTTVVGVYGMSKATRGQCFATYVLESPAVSVSLSPTARNLLVGLTSRVSRMALAPRDDRSVMAQIFKIQLPAAAAAAAARAARKRAAGENPTSREAEAAMRGRLIHRHDIHQLESGMTSLNCIRWLPVAGQGIVYATNTGLLKIIR